jgi:hypothetical protein
MNLYGFFFCLKSIIIDENRNDDEMQIAAATNAAAKRPRSESSSEEDESPSSKRSKGLPDELGFHDLPIEIVSHSISQEEATWRCSSGHAPTAAPGTRPVYAARGGHLEVLQWARANGCPWDEWTCCLPQQEEATWRCCSGHAPTAAPGTRDLCQCSKRRPPGGAPVGTRQRLPLGRADLFQCSRRRPPGGAPVGTRQRLPLGRETCAMQQQEATWRCCSGHAPTAAPGTRRPVPGSRRRPPGGVAVGTRQRLPLGRADLCQCSKKEATWRCSSGHAPTAAPGTSGPVPIGQQRRPPGGAPVGTRQRLPLGREDLFLMQQKEATWRCCSGHAPTAAPGTSGPVGSRRRPPGGAPVGTRQRLPLGRERTCANRRQQEEATWRCSSGHAPTAAPTFVHPLRLSSRCPGCSYP